MFRRIPISELCYGRLCWFPEHLDSNSPAGNAYRLVSQISPDFPTPGSYQLHNLFEETELVVEAGDTRLFVLSRVHAPTREFQETRQLNTVRRGGVFWYERRAYLCLDYVRRGSLGDEVRFYSQEGDLLSLPYNTPVLVDNRQGRSYYNTLSPPVTEVTGDSNPTPPRPQPATNDRGPTPTRHRPAGGMFRYVARNRLARDKFYWEIDGNRQPIGTPYRLNNLGQAAWWLTGVRHLMAHIPLQNGMAEYVQMSQFTEPRPRYQRRKLVRELQTGEICWFNGLGPLLYDYYNHQHLLHGQSGNVSTILVNRSEVAVTTDNRQPTATLVDEPRPLGHFNPTTWENVVANWSSGDFIYAAYANGRTSTFRLADVRGLFYEIFLNGTQRQTQIGQIDECVPCRHVPGAPGQQVSAPAGNIMPMAVESPGLPQWVTAGGFYRADVGTLAVDQQCWVFNPATGELHECWFQGFTTARDVTSGINRCIPGIVTLLRNGAPLVTRGGTRLLRELYDLDLTLQSLETIDYNDAVARCNTASVGKVSEFVQQVKSRASEASGAQERTRVIDLDPGGLRPG